MNDGNTVPSAAVSDRRSFRLGKSMMPLFVGLAAVLLALALSIGQTVIAQRDARLRAVNEGGTLLVLNELMSAMLNAETGQRGFLLTTRPQYLTPYLNAKERRDRAMDRLREISARTQEEHLPQAIDRLESMTEAKFAEMDRSVKMAQTGQLDQALALTHSDFGKLQMDAIRREISTLGRAKADQRSEAFENAAKLERRLLPLVGVLSAVILALVYAGFRAEGRRSLAEAEAQQAAALREANERTELLARELNHRVKNLFSVILSIVTLSGRKQASSDEVVKDIRARIRALSLAHSASQGGYGTPTVELGPVIARTMEPYCDDEGQRVRVEGPEVELPARMVTPIGLIVHELATNAVKYGALSVEGGTVAIRWTVGPEATSPLLTLEWVETGGPPVAAGTQNGNGGFGSQMTTLAAGQLGGTIERAWPTTGAAATLRFPLPSA